VLGLGVLFGGQAWRNHQEEKLMQASDLYQQVLDAADAGDAGQVSALARQLAADYQSSPYDTQAQLALAKLQVESGDLESALTALEAAAASAEDVNTATIARTRQARVLLALERPDEALDLLGAAPPAQFAPMHHELRGDALAQLGRTAEARTAYVDALSAANGGSGGLIELKIAALGPEASGASTTGSETMDGAEQPEDGDQGAADGGSGGEARPDAGA
jgi:predicted negative regulator of RcsB-dependent stress response